MAGEIIYTHTHTHTYRHTDTQTHIHTYTHMFASMVITTPQGSIILCFVNQNNELSINAKCPIFQCVKSVRIPSFSGWYVTTLVWIEYGDLSNTDTFYRLFSEL